MTHATDSEDTQWLNALAGRPDTTADPNLNRQTEAVRKALEERRRATEAETPVADASLYEQLLFRLRREALIGPRVETESGDLDEDEWGMLARRRGVAVPREAAHELEQFIEAEDKRESRSRAMSERLYRPSWRTVSAWAVAATVVLGLGLALQMGLPWRDQASDDLTYRGDAQSTVLVVADPEARLTELLQGLESTAAEPKVERIDERQIRLTLKARQDVLDYLSSQRIEPMVKDGTIVLVLSAD